MNMRAAASLAIVLASAGSAIAGVTPNVTIFGQNYSVKRFVLHDSVKWPNPHPNAAPNSMLGMAECEGTLYLGNNRILFSSDAIGETFAPNCWKNFIVEAQFIEDPSGQYVGLQYVRTVLINDGNDGDLDGTLGPLGGWDLSPSGMTINPTSTGIGAGGQLLVTDNTAEGVRAYTLAPGSGPQNAQTCPLPFGPTCAIQVTCDPSNTFGIGCILNTTPNNNNEDLTWVPINGGEVWTIWEDFPFFIARHKPVYTPPPQGQPAESLFIGSFPIARTGFGEPKGVVFVPNSPRFPAPFRSGVGAVLVSGDDNGPALEVFDTVDTDGEGPDEIGTSVAYLDLVTEGPNGFFDSPPGGDDVYLFGDREDYAAITMQIESVSADPETGRLFITVQSDGLFNNFLYVLTPSPLDRDLDTIPDAIDNCRTVANTSQANSDADSLGDACDNCRLVSNNAQTDSNADGLGNACSCPGDANRDGSVNFADVTTVLNNFNTAYTYPVVPPANAAGDANNSGAVNFADVTTVLNNFANVCG